MNLNNVDLNKLAIFSTIVDAGNYRKASEVLNVTPSALSQSITVLESSLGISLFHRVGKKMVLTEQGIELHRVFKGHFMKMTESLQSIVEPRDTYSGMIHIGSYLEFAQRRLTRVITQFLKMHPKVQVRFVFDTPTRLQRLLEERRIDFCFSIYPNRESRLIQSEPIYNEELLLVAPRGLISEKPTFEEVLNTPMVEYYLNHQPIRRWLRLHYNKNPKNLPIRAYGATAEMVLTLIREGLGIGIVPAYLVYSETLKTVSICRPTNRKLKDHIWLLQLKNQNLSLSQKAIFEDIRTHLNHSEYK